MLNPRGIVVSRLSSLAWWALVAWVIVFWQLGHPSLLDPDEAHYAQLTREMMRARNWLVPLLDGVPYIDKPVLFHWLQAIAVKAFGESEFSTRLPSALAALALIGTTRMLGATLFGSKVGEWGALMLATMPATFVLGRIGMIDMVYTALLFGGVSCLITAALRGPTRLQYPGYVLLALAVATKGPVALVMCALLALASFAAGPELRAGLRRLSLGRGGVLIAVCAAPWFAWMWITFGGHFIQSYVFAGNLWYFTQPASFSTRAAGPLFYLRIFVTAFFPWSLIACGYALDLAVNRRHERVTPEVRVLLIWVALVIGFFSAARFKLDHYIFPAAPACCLLAARAWSEAAADGARRWTRTAAAVVAVTLVMGGMVTSVALFRINLGLDVTALILPIALGVGGALLGLQIFWRGGYLPPSLQTPLVTLLVIYGAIVVVGFPVIEESRPTPPVAEWIAAHSATDTPIGAYHVDDWQASIRYYADRRVVRIGNAEELTAFFEQHPDAYVLTLESDVSRIRQMGLDVRQAAGRRAIVGRTGRYLRTQVWGQLVAVSRRHLTQARDKSRIPTS